jgi:hypothetical protein
MIRDAPPLRCGHGIADHFFAASRTSLAFISFRSPLDSRKPSFTKLEILSR